MTSLLISVRLLTIFKYFDAKLEKDILSLTGNLIFIIETFLIDLSLFNHI